MTKIYTHYCRGAETPEIFVKWLRRNLGARGEGWDFRYSVGNQAVHIEIWSDRLKTMYEMWKT